VKFLKHILTLGNVLLPMIIFLTLQKSRLRCRLQRTFSKHLHFLKLSLIKFRKFIEVCETLQNLDILSLERCESWNPKRCNSMQISYILRNMLHKKPLIAKLDFDTAENGRRQGCCMIRAREPLFRIVSFFPSEHFWLIRS
jgi:hypothetical protein